MIYIDLRVKIKNSNKTSHTIQGFELKNQESRTKSQFKRNSSIKSKDFERS